MKIGIIKEGKTPPDKRVPLSPEQCKEVKEKFPNVDVLVQTSDIRCFKDDEYKAEGIEVVEDVSNCDILMGVKEVPMPMLIDNKTYLFFSHTIKKQPYNRELLQKILERNIQMVDYECLKHPNDGRILGFGRYAGIVGCYNGFLAYGKRTSAYDLKPANECHDYKELKQELKKVKLPSNYKIVLTGYGRVGHGALEIIHELKLKEVGTEEFLPQSFNEPVFTVLDVTEYYKLPDGGKFDKKEVYHHPEKFESCFMDFAKVADMYVACHYWDSKAPFIFTREDMKSPDWNIKVVADISCDIDGPVACTIRPSTISEPLYGYHPATEKEVAFDAAEAITVMAVDNLPCELPRDASEDFGRSLIDKVFEHLLVADEEKVIANASITKDGELTENFKYLTDYVNGV